MANNFNIPILFLIFNRPDTTQVVFDKIKNIKPTVLFVAGDGPRNSEERKIVNQTREIINQIDWDCDVETLYRNNNLGCKTAVSSAIDWFFENNEMGIILEDDCVPHESFFRYCEELLVKYKDEMQVMQICGYNPLEQVRINESYYFGKFGPIWGWASWQRAWKHYDVSIKKWDKIKNDKSLKKYCDSILEEKWRIDIYDRVKSGMINTWDYQWSFAKLINEGLSIIPAQNLITNIGFGENATHTSVNIVKKNVELNTASIFPLVHSKKIERNKKLDKKFFYTFVIKNKVKGLYNKIFGKLS